MGLPVLPDALAAGASRALLTRSRLDWSGPCSAYRQMCMTVLRGRLPGARQAAGHGPGGQSGVDQEGRRQSWHLASELWVTLRGRWLPRAVRFATVATTS